MLKMQIARPSLTLIKLRQFIRCHVQDVSFINKYRQYERNSYLQTKGNANTFNHRRRRPKSFRNATRFVYIYNLYLVPEVVAISARYRTRGQVAVWLWHRAKRRRYESCFEGGVTITRRLGPHTTTRRTKLLHLSTHHSAQRNCQCAYKNEISFLERMPRFLGRG